MKSLLKLSIQRSRQEVLCYGIEKKIEKEGRGERGRRRRRKKKKKEKKEEAKKEEEKMKRKR